MAGQHCQGSALICNAYAISRACATPTAPLNVSGKLPRIPHRVAWIVILAQSLSFLLCCSRRCKLSPGLHAVLGLAAADGLSRYAVRRTYAPLSCIRACKEQEVRKIGLSYAFSGIVKVVWIRESSDWVSSLQLIFTSVLPRLLKDAAAH